MKEQAKAKMERISRLKEERQAVLEVLQAIESELETLLMDDARCGRTTVIKTKDGNGFIFLAPLR